MKSELAQARATATRWWAALAPRERRASLAAAALLAVAVVWLVLLGPALRTLARAPAQIEAADAQLQKMRAQAAEAAELRGAAPVSTEQAAAALKAATERLGSTARLTLQGDRAVLVLTDIAPGALRDWLAEVRAGARARPVEATVTRGAKGLSGSLVLAIGAAS